MRLFYADTRTPENVIEAAGKAMQRKTHLDAGGSDADFQEVQEAIRESPRASDKAECSSSLVTAPPKQDK